MQAETTEGADLEVEPSQWEWDSGGTLCRGWFYRPPGTAPYACVIMAHGFGASPDGPLGDLGRRLARSGIAALAFDYRHFGASDGQPRQLLRTRRVLEDWMAAIACARSHDEVDAGRLGLWGSSVSGGHVLAIAARDPGIAATVAQVPYVDGFALARAVGLRHHLKTVPALVRDLVRAGTGRSPYLIASLAPDDASAALTTRSSVVYRALVKSAPEWRNEITARSLLEMYRFRAVKEAAKIRSPLLVVLTYQDHLTPLDITTRAAEKLPYVELAMFPGRHFELYAGETHERAMHTEVRFLLHHLKPAERPALLAKRSGHA